MSEPRGTVLIDQERIARRVREVGEALSADLDRERVESGLSEDDSVQLILVMTGALVFAADLIRAMPVRMRIRPVTFASYPGKATSSQGLHVVQDVPDDLGGRRVVIVDDILDSGRTLAEIKRRVMRQSPASVRVVVLLRKEKERDDPVESDVACFDIPDAFVIGCGLDYDGMYRNLPDVRVLAESEQGG
ncbi:MAG: phosphoribosyltransferase [Phycisphaerales bacterium]